MILLKKRHFMATCQKVVTINTQIYQVYSMNGAPQMQST